MKKGFGPVFLKWPTNSEQHAYMRDRQSQNRERAANNPNEKWMAEKLSSSGLKWTPQAQWGYRIFDFWCANKGVAIEVDGPEHDAEFDAFRDAYNFKRSGIVVLRVRNRNETDAAAALDQVRLAITWKERRFAMGIERKRKWPCS